MCTYLLDPNPHDAALSALRASDVAASRLERLAVYEASPMVDLTREDAVSEALFATLRAAGVPNVEGARVRDGWYEVPRESARRLLLYPLRFSMAYGAVKGRGGRQAARRVASEFVEKFGPDARFFNVADGLAGILDEDGATPKGGFGYGSRISVSGATFEVAVIAIDWERCGFALFTDED